MVAQQSHNLVETLTSQQFCGVGRHRTGQKEVEVAVDAGGDDVGLHVEIRRDTGMGEQVGDTPAFVGDAEQAAQGGLTDIKTTEDDLLAQEGERHGKIGGIECLAFTWHRGRKKNDFLVLLQHKLDICAHGAEYLINLMVTICLDHDASRFFHAFTGYWYISHDVQCCQTLHIIMPAYLVAEQVDENQNQCRDEETCHNCQKEYDSRLWSNFSFK